MKRIFLFFFGLLLLGSAGPASAQTAKLRGQITSGLYRIVNAHYTDALGQNFENGTLKATTKSTSDKAQIWKIEALASGTGYTLRNAYTGLYASYTTEGSTPFPTSAAPVTWFIEETSGHYTFTYDNSKPSGYVFLHERSGGDAVNWVSNADASLWDIERVTDLTEDALLSDIKSFRDDYPDGCSYLRITNRIERTAGNTTLTDATGQYNSQGVLTIAPPKAADDHSQWWLLEPSGYGYTLRNAKTGNYIANHPNGGIYASGTPSTFYLKYSANNGTDQPKQYITICSSRDFSGKTALHNNSASKVIKWNPGKDNLADNIASDWQFDAINVNDALKAQIRNNISSAQGYDAPTDGGYFRLYNKRAAKPLSENITAHDLSCKDYEEKDFSQVWKIVKGNGDYYALQNALTGNYIQGFTSGYYQVGATAAYHFTFPEFNLDQDLLEYNIKDKGFANQGLNYNSGGYITKWGDFANDKGSQWHLKAVAIDAVELQAAQENYRTGVQDVANNDIYATALRTFFADHACTQLKSEYQAKSDEELKNEMEAAGLPTSLQEIAVKVKNSAWATYAEGWKKTEQTFRVADYRPYSDCDQWHDILQTGYRFGRLSNPTGIHGRRGDIIYIFVNEAPAAGSTLGIEAVNGTNTTGTYAELKQGLNTFVCPEDVNLFVSYWVTANTTTTAKGNARILEQPLLAGFPPIKIHIEGGQVNGYFDCSEGKGDTNEDWKLLTTHLLKESDVVNLKAERYVHCMNRDRVKAACPEKMVELMGVWNRIAVLQFELMGLESKDIKSRFNNIINGYSMKENEGDYMHASSYGTFFNESTLFKVMNYEKMSTIGDLWGPAHETGHLHQKLLNMIGCTEVSNNIFSNVALYDQGHQTSNTTAPAETAANLAKNVFWLDRNVYERTRMYWQLYLYYHVAGHKPDFYPTLFRLLRDDPMTRTTAAVNEPANDYLKFAVKCCEAAGEDLSEFFEAYGFFVQPSVTVTFKEKQCYKINDYGDYYINAGSELDQQIADAKAEMQAYNKKNGNILFIDDRIEPVIGKDGEPKEKFYESGDPNNHVIDFAGHEYGEMGHYTDFFVGADATTTKAFRYTVDANGHVQVAGDGAVGFKVYAADGSLVCISNTSAFTLPAGLENYKIVAAKADGSDLEAKPVDKVYALDVYEGNALGTPKYATDTDDLPLLDGNAVAVLRETDAPATLTALPNVIDKTADGSYTAARFVLTDKRDFYAPCDFTATALTYERTNTAGYNSVCLPFALTTGDLPGSNLYTLAGFEEDPAVGTFTVRFADTNAVAAGEPCLVKSPADGTSWNLSKENVPVKGSPVSGKVLSDGMLRMTGSFANGPIGAGKYKLNSTGDAFGITTAAGKVTAFRMYLEASEELAAAATRLGVTFGGGEVTAAQVPVASSAPQPAYDLQGRRVARPVKGGLYIVGGKKVLK